MSGNGTHIELSDDWTEGGWFTFPRRFARDRKLSWKAKGIAALLASHSSTFMFSATELEKWAKDGRDGTAAGIRELEAAGYLVRERKSSGEMVYRLFPEPQPENPEVAGQEPHTENPVTENPVTEKPGVHKKTTPKETTSLGETHQGDISATDDALFSLGAPAEPDTEPEDGPTFDEFWSVYPLRKAKGAARKSWMRLLLKLPKDQRVAAKVAIVDGAERYAKERADQDARFTKHPATWLNGGCWEDDPAPASNPAGGYRQYRNADYYPDAKPWFDPDALDD